MTSSSLRCHAGTSQTSSSNVTHVSRTNGAAISATRGRSCTVAGRTVTAGAEACGSPGRCGVPQTEEGGEPGEGEERSLTRRGYEHRAPARAPRLGPWQPSSHRASCPPTSRTSSAT
ncbi:Uncharacterised protein [Mycobacteroides abscessus]|nr:Uncharacterised protein [Mycobacteroides abscessus]